MYLNKGDRVIHNTFPPVEGRVSVLMDMMNDERKIGVKQDSGLVFYDKESTWDLIEGIVDIDYIDTKYKEI